MSINRRYRRADLVISPVGCFAVVVIVSVLFVLTVAVWSR